jgi:AraC-like DNA-binding protein
MSGSSTPALRRARARGVQGILDMVRRRYGEGLTLRDLQQASGLRQSTLARRFHKEFQTTPMQWLWTLRVAIAVELIRGLPWVVLGDVAAECGFASAAHFTRKFAQLLRLTPSEFRNRLRHPEAKPPSADALHAHVGEIMDAAFLRAAGMLLGELSPMERVGAAAEPLQAGLVASAAVDAVADAELPEGAGASRLAPEALA